MDGWDGDDGSHHYLFINGEDSSVLLFAACWVFLGQITLLIPSFAWLLAWATLFFLQDEGIYWVYLRALGMQIDMPGFFYEGLRDE